LTFEAILSLLGQLSLLRQSPLQGKCLTAIESKRVRRLGAVVEQPLDVKLMAATQVALGEQVQAGHFRADLYHRLAVVVLELPPLREGATISWCWPAPCYSSMGWPTVWDPSG
jgi:transcriptional regulator with PAS, ATPase and Fis domain